MCTKIPRQASEYVGFVLPLTNFRVTRKFAVIKQLPRNVFWVGVGKITNSPSRSHSVTSWHLPTKVISSQSVSISYSFLNRTKINLTRWDGIIHILIKK
jgi:hypothetical protein